MKKEIYFCYHCRNKISSFKEALFVQDSTSDYFCSEVCVENFYTPVVESFVQKELELREKHNVYESLDDELKDIRLIQEVFSSATYLSKKANLSQEEYYCFSKKIKVSSGKELYFSLFCFVLNKKPSFVIHTVVTENESLYKALQFQIEISNIEEYLKGKEELPFDKEGIIETLEQKKSFYLAKLMEIRSEEDILFEEFHLYDQFIGETIKNPDEIYMCDEDNDQIFIYIKACEKKDLSFFYIALCLKIESQSEDGSGKIISFLTFPTTSKEVHEFFQRGDHILEHLMN